MRLPSVVAMPTDLTAIAPPPGQLVIAWPDVPRPPVLLEVLPDGWWVWVRPDEKQTLDINPGSTRR